MCISEYECLELAFMKFVFISFSRPFVEYKGTGPLNELQNKQREIEIEVNALISKGGKVSII